VSSGTCVHHTRMYLVRPVAQVSPHHIHADCRHAYSCEAPPPSSKLSAAPHRNAYRALLLIYGLVFCGCYIPVMLWIMPDEPFAVGDVYVWGSSWRPVTKLRSELEVKRVFFASIPCPAVRVSYKRETLVESHIGLCCESHQMH
jgi:hypothetical protein